jgi:8-oxo-dGTP diphosphatase
MDNSEAPKETLYNIGVKAAILSSDNRVLLLNITYKNSSDTYWDLPGGRIADGEAPEDTLKREVKEETGITEFTVGPHLIMGLSRVQLPGPSGKKIGIVFSIYEGRSDSKVEEPEERITMHWCTIPEAVANLKTNPGWPDEIIEAIGKIGSLNVS